LAISAMMRESILHNHLGFDTLAAAAYSENIHQKTCLLPLTFMSVRWRLATLTLFGNSVLSNRILRYLRLMYCGCFCASKMQCVS